MSNLIESESGNVESALVLIPLISLFLITLQLIATVNLRNVSMAATQNQASLQAVHQVVEPGNQLISLKSGNLFSKLRILVVKTEYAIPQIFPGVVQLIGGKRLLISGAAVYEEPEECVGGYAFC